MEGYPLAAATLSKEANLQPRQEDHAVKARQEIKHSIHEGNIQQAIEALNELDPEVCLFSPIFLNPEPSTMIRTRVYMHHAYGLRAVDDKQPPF